MAVLEKKGLFNRVFIVFILCSIFSCKPNPKKIDLPIIPTPIFVLSENERKLLCNDSCTKEINMDTVKSFANFNAAKLKFYKNKKNEFEKICISFSFSIEDSSTGFDLKFNYELPYPYPYSLGGGINLSNYNYLYGFVINKNQMDISTPFTLSKLVDTKDLNEIIKRIYKKPIDTFRTANFNSIKKRFISLSFLHDNIDLINPILSQLTIGYIKAQREICKEYFKKDINDATSFELNELRRKNPFVLRITKINQTLKILIRNPQPPTNKPTAPYPL